MPATKQLADEVAKLPYRGTGRPQDNQNPDSAEASNDAEIEYDNLVIADMRVKGYTYQEIADKVGLDPRTVMNKWSSIRSHWRKKRLGIVDGYMHEEIAKLDALEQEYWRSYRASTKVIEYTIIDDELDAVSEVSKELQAGDPRYLDGVLKCMHHKAKLLGLYKMEKATSELSDTVRTILELPEGSDNARAIGAIATAIEQLHKPEMPQD